MEAQKLLEAPKAKPKIVARVSKVNNLVEVSTQARKSSLALRKTFEKGVYQRKTQLSVLNRYKRRLDTINKEQDKKFEKKTKEKPKKTKIPKFKGFFFTKGSSDDPLKAIGALAAFNSLEKLLEGDLLGALSPGMVAAGALLGPGLLGLVGGAAEGFFTRGPKPGRGFDVSGRRVSTSTQQRYLSRYGDKAFKNRFGKDALKTAQQGVDAGQGLTKGARTAKAFSKFGSALIPGVGAVVGAADAAMRAQAGDQFGAAIAGTGAALDAAAAASAATGIGLPIAGLLSIASFALDATNLIRDLTGMSAAEEQKNKKLKEQTKKEKELSKQGSILTFSKTLTSYEVALKKFEEFSKSFNIKKKSDQDYRESFEPNIAPGQEGPGGTMGPKAPEQVLSDAASFRQAFPLPAGTPPKSADPYELQLRENTGLGNFGNDPTVDDVHVPGSAHYENRAIDIPINNMELGDRVAKWWKDKGYYVLWRTSGHYNHVHVQWAAKEGANRGAVITGPKTGYPVILHGKEAIIPIDNYHTQGGGDPLQNVPVNIINAIASKSKIYQTAMAEMPPEVISVPMPVMPPQIQYVSSGSAGSLNIQDDADKRILKMLYYSALG